MDAATKAQTTISSVCLHFRSPSDKQWSLGRLLLSKRNKSKQVQNDVQSILRRDNSSSANSSSSYCCWLLLSALHLWMCVANDCTFSSLRETNVLLGWLTRCTCTLHTLRVHLRWSDVGIGSFSFYDHHHRRCLCRCRNKFVCVCAIAAYVRYCAVCIALPANTDGDDDNHMSYDVFHFVSCFLFLFVFLFILILLSFCVRLLGSACAIRVCKCMPSMQATVTGDEI